MLVKVQLTENEVAAPAVFDAPIRPDVVALTHKGIAKNKRQAYAVKAEAGEVVSALSWGTGRAVARVPRIRASGTSASGRAAQANFATGGRMFAPTKIWRKWHTKVPQGQRRYAVCSAIAASKVQGLVKGRGHIIDDVPQLPLVVGNAFEEISKTSEAFEAFEKMGVADDVLKIKQSRKIRAGRGKARNRRWRRRRGPLVVYKNKGAPVVEACRNLGVETCPVDALNLLQLAPGGHLGRLVVWTQGAFEALDEVFGTSTEFSTQKKGFKVPRNIITVTDIQRLIKAEEIQAVVRPNKSLRTFRKIKRNPLKNREAKKKLNPAA
ncbi:hypothetical protein PCE1_003840 [Barthelona sp. PCE]